MAEFKCITQLNNTTNFQGPSGRRYMSRRGDFFKVENKDDIAHFQRFPKRFEGRGKVGKAVAAIAGKRAVSKHESAEEVLRAWAEGLKGVSKASAEELSECYNDKKEIISDIEQGYEVRGDISDRQKNIIRRELGYDVDGGKLE